MANIDYRQQPLEAAKESVRNWLDETALVTKFFILLSIAGSFLSLTSVIGIDLVQIFANIPYKAIIGLQIHRLIFSWALPSSFFGGLFQALSLFTVLQKIEQKRGSVYLLVQILVLNFISQVALNIAKVLFAVFCLFFGLFVQVISVQTSVGMWVLFFNVLPIVLKEPFQERGVPFFLVKIPPVVYPFVLCVFFQFFGFNLDIVFGAVVGHLASYKYRYLELSSSQLKYLEKIWIVRVLRTRAKGFAVSDISEYDGLPVLF
ncbi:hypothetical protein MHBO_000910 [Bonamia ostreae]|uniref:Derlin n=1 Tax=Bonamia ostreae TaxID=126728 RepID=A0ABV2AH98_9EUKA